MSKKLTVPFRGNDLLCVEDDGGEIYVALRPVTTGIGLDFSAQLRRVRRDPILGPAVAVMATESGPNACLPMHLLPGYLFRVSANRVAPGVRERLLVFQRECFATLAAAFGVRGAPLVNRNEPLVDPPAPLPPQLARAIVCEARHTFGAHVARALWLDLGLPIVPAMIGKAGDLFNPTTAH